MKLYKKLENMVAEGVLPKVQV